MKYRPIELYSKSGTSGKLWTCEILVESTLCCVLIWGKNVVWFLYQFESTELMGTLSIEPVPDPYPGEGVTLSKFLTDGYSLEFNA